MSTYLARACRAHNHSTELAHLEEVVIYAIWCFVLFRQAKQVKMTWEGGQNAMD
jgi:hypothetical protein